MTDVTGIFNTAMTVLPGIIAMIRENHRQANPDAPALTDQEVLEAFQQAVASSLAKGEAWLAAHPTEGGGA